MSTPKGIFIGGGLFLLIGLIFIYRFFDPALNGYFPRCPFLLLTHLKCPGCGSQRAIHYLLCFDMMHAAKQNILLVVAIPYILLGAVLDIVSIPHASLLKWRNILYGQKAIYVVLVVIMAFWIFRNLFSF